MTKSLRFDLFDLRLYVAVVELGSLSKAAESLPLALSAASVRIKTLEDRLGVRLLERGSRGVSANNAGKLFYDHALRLLRVAAEAQQGMDALSGKGGVKLTLMSNTTGLSTHLPNQLGEFLQNNPEVDLTFEQNSSSEVLKAVNSGKADLGIVDGDYGQRDLHYLLYQRNQLVVIAHVDNPLAQQTSCRFADWLKQPLVGYASDSSLQKFLERMADMAHQPVNFRVSAPNFNSVASFVAANIGAAIVPKPLAERYESLFPIKTVELDEPWANRELHVCMRAESESNMPSLRLAKFLAGVD